MKKKKLLTDRSGMLHEQYIEQAADRLAEDIDAEVMRGMLKECGWAEVTLGRMHKPEKRIIEQWASAHIKKGVWTYGPVWLFKEEKEANWFKLRWMS